MLVAVVALYFLAVLTVGIVLARRVKKASDFLVAGRKLGLLLTTASLAAVQIGAGVILGGAEMGAEKGLWPGMWYGIGCGGGLVLAGVFVAGKLRTRSGFVPLDFFADRYGEMRWVRIWAWLSNIPSLLGILVAQLMAAGSVLSSFGLDYAWAVIIVGLVVMFYCILAGMWGVVAADSIQVSIVVIGIPLIAALALSKIGGLAGAAQFVATPFIPTGLGSKAIFLIAPFLLSISVSYDAYMRYQAARSAQVARWGCILAGIIVMGISFCTAMVGTAGRRIFPEVANASVLPHMIQALLNPILAGLVVSALLAAAMSCSSCLLISLSGCFARDLYNKVLHPAAQLDDLKYARLIPRLTVLGSLAAGIWIALQAKGILYTMIIFNYPYMGSMLVPLLGGVLWKGATSQGALAALCTGGIIGVGAFIIGISSRFQGLFNVDLGLFAAYAVSAIVFVAVSLKTARTFPDSTL
jgi:solute:Na+ symporter, SSS family